MLEIARSCDHDALGHMLAEGGLQQTPVRLVEHFLISPQTSRTLTGWFLDGLPRPKGVLLPLFVSFDELPRSSSRLPRCAIQWSMTVRSDTRPFSTTQIAFQQVISCRANRRQSECYP